MRRYFFLSVLIVFSINLYCQNTTIKGIIKDLNSNLPIPYAYVFIKGTSFGTISNSDGRYVFYLPKTPARDSIVVSCIGYSTKSFSLESIKDSIFDISLRIAPILLQEVKVSPLNIKSILEKALKNISENYPTKPSILKGVFHQSLKQDDLYVRLVDAAIEIYNPTYKSNRKESNQIKLLNARASFDNSIIGSQIPYQPSIVLDLLFFNEPIGAFIKAFDSFKFNISGIIRYEDSELYVVEFDYLKSNKKVLSTKGTIYIDKTTQAVVSFRLVQGKHFESTLSYMFNEKPVNATMIFESAEGRIDYIKFNSKWILNYIGIKDNFIIKYDDTPKLYKMEFFHELFINECQLDGVKKFNENELINPNKDLYKQIGKYDNSIWDSFNRLIPTDFENKIRKTN